MEFIIGIFISLLFWKLWGMTSEVKKIHLLLQWFQAEVIQKANEDGAVKDDPSDGL